MSPVIVKHLSPRLFLAVVLFSPLAVQAQERGEEFVDPETNDRIADAEQHARRLQERLQFVQSRISWLKKARAAEQAMGKIRVQIEDAEDKGNEKQQRQLERQLQQHEINRDEVEGRLELIEHRMGLLELRDEFRNPELESFREQLPRLEKLLDSQSKLLSHIYEQRRAGKDREAEGAEEELGAVENQFHFHRERLQLNLELFFAEEDGNDDDVEELKDALNGLYEEFDQPVPKGVKIDRGPAEPPEVEPPVSLTAAEIQTIGQQDFIRAIAPLLKQSCFECHGNDSASGDLNLERLVNQRPFVRNRQHWKNVIQQLRIRSMPPADAEQPDEKDRRLIVGWLKNAVENFDYASVSRPGDEPARRLTHTEFNNTIRDLTGLDLRPADRFPVDMTASSGFENSANTLFIQPILLERYVNAAEEIVNQAWPEQPGTLEESARWDQLTGGRDLANISAVRSVLQQFASRAYRRPVSTEELDSLSNHFQRRTKNGASSVTALRDVLKVILVSPNFLIRSERQRDQTNKYAITDWELASRLSYFLWASMPDDELRTLARRELLHEDKVLSQQVDRLLADARSESLGEIFAAQWLGIQNLDRVQRDQIDNPWATDSLVEAMYAETAMLFNSLVQDDLPIDRIVDADYTFLNEELARHYRLPNVQGSHMRRISLAQSPRRGVMGHASILAVTSFPGRTSPVVRGNWILTSLLGTPPPPPPPNVSEFDERVAENERLSPRQKLERHRNNPNCYTCHSQIDPLGFALEEFEWFGRDRGKRRGKPIDASAKLPTGETFRGLIGLSEVLVKHRSEDLARQFTEKLLAYALGRQLDYYDEATVRNLIGEFSDRDRKVPALIKAIVLSDSFRMKQHVAAPDSGQ